MPHFPFAEPVFYRKNIPFYTNKTEAEFRADPYEYYDGMVQRQLRLHLGGIQHPNYAWQPIEDWVTQHFPANFSGRVLEIGCSVGKLIGQLAEQHPRANCYGCDFSYQLLKIADNYWCRNQAIECTDERGFPPLTLHPRPPLLNLQFGLARAEQLPFPDHCIDVVVSSFLFDRLENPTQAVTEWQRVLKPGGKLLLLTPLNFQQKAHWEAFYPEARFFENFKVAKWITAEQSQLTVREPLDVRGNVVEWRCVAAKFTAPLDISSCKPSPTYPVG